MLNARIAIMDFDPQAKISVSNAKTSVSISVSRICANTDHLYDLDEHDPEFYVNRVRHGGNRTRSFLVAASFKQLGEQSILSIAAFDHCQSHSLIHLLNTVRTVSSTRVQIYNGHRKKQ